MGARSFAAQNIHVRHCTGGARVFGDPAKQVPRPYVIQGRGGWTRQAAWVPPPAVTRDAVAKGETHGSDRIQELGGEELSAAMTVRWTGSQGSPSSSFSIWRPGAGTMDRANREIRLALDRSRRRRLVQSGKRRCLNAIDDCLNKLEEMHAAGAHISRRDGCRKVVAQLVEAIRQDPPEDVQTARNSYDLHSALLNWQSGVLDALVPHRRELFPDLNLERDDWPRPRRRRRRAGAAGALAAA